MGRLEEDIARLERSVRGGDAGPDTLLRLGQLFLRADLPERAQEVLTRAQETLRPQAVARDAAGEIGGLHPLWTEINDTLERAGVLAEERTRRTRRQELVARLEASGLEPHEHDELIRLEVDAGVDVHPQMPRCPACRGPVTDAAEGQIRCARSGQEGDLCRHTDAKGLFACSGCGLVVRAWNERRLKTDALEPPLLRPEKARCELCQGGVVDWRKHFLACPRGKPRDFPRCDICRGRGFHRRALLCPRCRTQVGETPCMEKKRRW